MGLCRHGPHGRAGNTLALRSALHMAIFRPWGVPKTCSAAPLRAVSSILLSSDPPSVQEPPHGRPFCHR